MQIGDDVAGNNTQSERERGINRATIACAGNGLHICVMQAKNGITIKRLLMKVRTRGIEGLFD